MPRPGGSGLKATGIDMTNTKLALAGMAGAALAATAIAVPVQAQYREKIANDASKCAAGAGSAVRVTITDIKDSRGTIRVQSYRATKQDWLEKGKWIYRMEAPAKTGTMTFCMPVPGPGSYGIAARHDLNGNGKTDIFGDGGAMSNDPSVNLFNMGKPSYKKAAFDVGSGVRSMTIEMRYR